MPRQRARSYTVRGLAGAARARPAVLTRSPQPLSRTIQRPARELTIFRRIRRGRGVAASGRMPTRRKNPHAMALGRLGGLKGGRAHASKLSARRRRDIARLAAMARWLTR